MNGSVTADLSKNIPRTWLAVSYGLLLSCLHTVVTVVLLDTDLHLVAEWQTVAANIIILVTVNLVGIFIHNLTEEGQRRAFLDTRDCIAARLEMEDENEKLVIEMGKFKQCSMLSIVTGYVVVNY